MSDEGWRPEEDAANREINRLIPLHFPELEDVYESEIVADGDWEGEGPLVVYGIVFHTFLERSLLTEPEGSDLVERLYGFLRLLDEREPYLATLGIGEFLAHSADPRARERARAHLGPNMREFIDRADL